MFLSVNIRDLFILRNFKTHSVVLKTVYERHFHLSDCVSSCLFFDDFGNVTTFIFTCFLLGMSIIVTQKCWEAFILILYPATLLKLFIIHRHFLIQNLILFTHRIVLSTNNISLKTFLSYLYYFYFLLMSYCLS